MRLRRCLRAPLVLTLFLAASLLFFPNYSFPESRESIKARLLVKDHTMVVRAVMENYPLILRTLDVNKFKLQNKKPSPTDILKAALKVEERIDVKDRIRLVLQLLPLIEVAQKEMSASDREAGKAIIKDIEELQTVPEMIKALTNMHAKYPRVEYESLSIGIEISIDMLRNGGASIYSADFKYYRHLVEAKKRSDKTISEHVNDVAKRDVKGLLIGAVRGCLIATMFTGGGCAAGAATAGIAVAIENSVDEVIAKVWD